jgi:electron transport complex protein RnfE
MTPRGAPPQRGGFALFSKSFFEENPLAILFLGLCPAIAVSVRVIDALWMSAGVTLVLVLSSLAMALLSSDSADGEKREGGTAAGRGTARLLRALVITSFLTASFEAGLLARAPQASASLGIYAPLIAVNCLVLGRRLPGGIGSSLGGLVTAALRRAIGFAACLVLIAFLREALGSGTITLFPVGGFAGTIEIRGLVDQPVRALGLAGGGLLCLGYLAAAYRAISEHAAATDPRGESSP